MGEINSKKVCIKFTLIIIISTLFMGIGYARISDNYLAIEGNVDVTLPNEVLINDVVYSSSNGADVAGSKINYFSGTMLDSQIVLGSTFESTITYKVSIYNNTDKEQLFIGVITNLEDHDVYSNKHIGVEVSGLREYVTTLIPGETLIFELTFKYNDVSNISNNVLSSKLNFRFQELPKLALSNDGEIYLINNMYPGYIKEYEFIVSNYELDVINNVSMSYYFETVINEGPFSIKIYDENGNEVNDKININGEGNVKVDHAYTLKVIWDNSDSGDSIDYSAYENKEFFGNVILKASPIDNDKYLDYIIVKQFDMKVVASPFCFNIEANTTIKMERESATLEVAINNYNSSDEYNVFDTNYEIKVEENDKFDFTVDGVFPVNDVVTRTLASGSGVKDSFDIVFMGDINNLEPTEVVTLKIITKEPYYKEYIYNITINLQVVTVVLNATGGNVSPSSMTVYKYLPYEDLPTPTWLGHTFNGWYTAENGGTKVTSTTEVTTSSSIQTLYARWTSYLLADVTSVGDYVDYSYVYYTNVATNSSGQYIPKSEYINWRVLSNNDLDGDGIKEVRLITAGVPMTYVYNRKLTKAEAEVDIANITTNFFSTAFASTSTTAKFLKNGFYKLDSGGSKVNITSISALKTAFTNELTQINLLTGNPMVQSITKDDLDAIVGFKTSDGDEVMGYYNYLLAIPSSDQSGMYASYYLAGCNSYSSYTNPWHLFNVRYYGAVVATQGEQGIRPVVTLKENVIKISGSGTQASPYKISTE